MNAFTIVKIAASLFVAMLALVIFQGYWLAQLELPYLLRSLLAMSGGMVLGYAASIVLLLWLEADNKVD